MDRIRIVSIAQAPSRLRQLAGEDSTDVNFEVLPEVSLIDPSAEEPETDSSGSNPTDPSAPVIQATNTEIYNATQVFK